MTSTYWREAVLDAIGLVHAAITYDAEAKSILLAYGETDLFVTGFSPSPGPGCSNGRDSVTLAPTPLSKLRSNTWTG